MSSITQPPDSLSFSRNLKKFIISSTEEVSFQLAQGATEILDMIYQPGEGDLVEIDLREIVDRLLVVTLPTAGVGVTDQIGAYADLIATIDGSTVNFRVIKGGVKDLDETAEAFTDDHWLTWQLQSKETLQYQPEWLSLYANGARVVVVKAYFEDDTDETIDLQTLATDKLYTIDVSWTAVNAALTKKNPVAWDVWFEDDSDNRLSYIQRYTLRDLEEEENIFIWVSTVGGIDSTSFRGYSEDDKGLDHLVSELYDGSFEESHIRKDRKIRQSTGWLSRDEARRAFDFFYSLNRWRVTYDGTIKAVVITEDKPKWSKQDDLVALEFTYQYAEDDTLLNLDRVQTQLSTLSAPSSFFLTDLLISLPTAVYNKNLLIPVQSPYGVAWQVISIERLFQEAVDIDFFTDETLQQLRDYIDSLIGGIIPTDSRSGIKEGRLMLTTGLTFEWTIFLYELLGLDLQANAGTTTLDAADATYTRIDAFYLDQWGNMQVKKGTPAENPTSPALTMWELLVQLVIIPAGATSPGNITVVKVYDEHAVDEWTASETHDTDVTVDLDSTNDPQTGSKCAEVEIAIPDTEVEIPLHYVGEHYQGGVIFWLAADGKSGLISAENDQEGAIIWETLNGVAPYNTGASGVAIGTGAANTALMLANPNCVDFAVRKAVNNALSIDGYKGWHIPSESELAEMWLRRNQIGGFGGKTYWSSTEVTGSHNWDRARCIAFTSGTHYTRDKNTNPYAVRMIRAFDDSELVANVPVVTYAPSNTALTFTAPAEQPVQDGLLTIRLRSSLAWLNNTMLVIESYLGAVKTGTAVISPLGNLWNYDPNDDAWQLAVVPMTAFLANNVKVDGFKISLAGSWPNNIVLGIDDVRYQIYGGTDPGMPPEPDYSEISFTASAAPEIADYDTLYASKYGPYPNVRLFELLDDGNIQPRQDVPLFEMTNGALTRIVFDLAIAINGFIVISK